LAKEQPARYEPSQAEPRWVAAWLDSGLLRADPDSGRPPYAIAVPPPNVTGALHMGHALNGTIQDALIRWHRMAGHETLWVLGTDHAGIATQAVVEKSLAAQGVRRQDLGRGEFERRVWSWKAEYGGRIVEQFTRLGCTLDYSRERFTMDEGYARAVLRVFVDLYEKGYVTRDRYIVNWDPGLRSAISDLEVETREVVDTLVQIAYPLADGDGEVVVATVRPETMLGDTAVAVSPDDERYRHLIGRSVILPLVARELPIVGDEHVDPAFGTGALKVTPAHDPNDFEIARRHGLDQVGVIGEDGRMTPAAGAAYAGLTVAECARRVLSDLRALGAVRGEEPYTHEVPHSQRSGARIEPLISLQWFCDMRRLAQPAMEVVRDGRVRFTPEVWSGVYLRWLEEIRPWCLSRQLWWGHQLPVWYRGEEVYVGVDPPEGEGWERDPDVLDTWFSSALWPFATLGWPDRTPELDRFYPTDLLSTAREIIFLWVARMVMMGLEYMGDVPFRDVYIHSVVQAPDGRRMSKSLGTGIDPLDVVATQGADALRFGLLMMSSTQDVRFSEDRVRQGRQLVTKLWNATQLVMRRGGAVQDGPPEAASLADRWIASRTAAAVEDSERLLKAFDFSALADLLYHLIFDDFCDWYLEALKVGQASPEMAGFVLEQLLALLHPVMPFVTEECWQALPGSSGMMLTHPVARPAGPRDAAAEAEMARVQEQVTALRAFRSDRGLAPRARLAVDPAPASLVAMLGDAEPAADGQVERLTVMPLGSGTLRVGPVEGDVDPAAERARVEADLARVEKELARAEGQLANERFVARAPAALVDAERDKVRRFRAEREALHAELGALGG
jgi:valyl-tRNA synthetase